MNLYCPILLNFLVLKLSYPLKILFIHNCVRICCYLQLNNLLRLFSASNSASLVFEVLPPRLAAVLSSSSISSSFSHTNNNAKQVIQIDYLHYLSAVMSVPLPA
jgi:hypothetical protein